MIVNARNDDWQVGDISRRAFLHRSAQAAAIGFAACKTSRTAQGQAVGETARIVDTHVYVGQWPLRRLACADDSEVVRALQREGVSQAWAGSFEGLFHKDVGGVNQRLADACREHGAGILVPFGVVNPRLPDWQEELRRCHEVHRMPGLRLHPNFHGYALDDDCFVELLKLASARRLVVQLVAELADELHKPFRLPQQRVDMLPLVDIAPRVKDLRLVVANGVSSVNDDSVRRLAPANNAWFDFASLTANDGLSQLFDVVPASRFLCGSGFPLAPLESIMKRLRESELNPDERQAIEADNAHNLANPPANG